MRFIKRISAFLSPAFLASAAAVMGIIGGANSLMNSGGGGSTSYGGAPAYTPAFQGFADTQWQELLRSISPRSRDLGGQIDPVLAAAFSKMLGIDTQPLVQAGQQAGQQYGDYSQMLQAFSQLLGGAGRETMAAGKDVYNLGRDPQEALRQRTQQRVVEGSRAADSARGIAMSPYSAGRETQAVTNFNIDWENQMLARALEGLNGMLRSGQVGGTQLQGGVNFAGQVPGATMASAGTPIEAATTAYNLPANAATNYAANVSQGVFQPQSAIMSQIIPYLNYGMGATQNAFSQYGRQQDIDFRTQQAGLSNLYGGLGALDTVANWPGSWLNNVWGGGGGSDYGTLYNAAYSPSGDYNYG